MITIASSAQNEITLEYLKSDDRLEEFGLILLRSCLHNRDILELALSIVNYNVFTSAYDKNDFLSGEAGTNCGLIFAGIIDFRACHHVANPHPRSLDEWVRELVPHLKRKFSQNPDWPLQYLHEAISFLLTQCSPPSIGELDLVCDGLVSYVYGVRLREADARTKSADPMARMKEIGDISQSIRLPGQEPVLVTSADHMATFLKEKTLTHSFKTGVRQFDQLYGDKAVPGEAWLGFGLPGGGKTVLSCQITGATAAIGRKVMLITTEVAPATCLLRACASQQGISYDALKAVRGTGSYGETDQGLQLQAWLDQTGRNISVIDYARVGGDSFEEKMDAMMNVFLKEHGVPPEMMLFDWIGKAANIAFADSWQKREHYSRVGAHVAQLADDLNIVTWALAQADPSIRNKTEIGETDTCDAKNLSQPFECAMALTSLMSPTEGEEMQETYKKNQWWVIPKHREAPPNKIPVLRRFESQRFADVH